MSEDSLSAWAITEGLKTRFVGQRLLYYPSLTSTMDIAREAVQHEAAEGTVVITEEQTAGRGRLQRPWLAPRGNIALSVILHTELSVLPYMIMLASLAVLRTARAVTGLQPQIKWPNDILINGKKTAGILIENEFQGNRLAGTIIGIGIDVNLKPYDYPEIKDIATSLAHESGKEISRLRVLRYLFVELEDLYIKLSARVSLFEEWRDNLVTLGKAVRATAGDTVYEGIAESVDRDGSLWLREENGKRTRIVAGDVTLK